MFKTLSESITVGLSKQNSKESPVNKEESVSEFWGYSLSVKIPVCIAVAVNLD